MLSRPGRSDYRARNVRFEVLEDRRLLAPVTVSTTSDVTDGDTSSIAALIASPGADNKISLREAIVAANFTQGADTIEFSTNPADGLNGGAIVLTQGQALIINGGVTIDATLLPLGLRVDASGNDPTPDSTPLDGNPLDDGDGTSVISITAAGSNTMVTLAGLTITGGDAVGHGGGISYTSNFFDSFLAIRDCKVVGNFSSTTVGEGGGIFAEGHAR